MGEPGGVSAEISVKAWQALRRDGPAFFVIDDAERLRAHGGAVKEITQPSHAVEIFSHALPVLPIGACITSTPGVSSADNAGAVIESIERAAALSISGQAGGVVTNPIQKSTLSEAGFKFPGHTEFLDELTKHAVMPAGRMRGCVMMLAGPLLKTVPVTIHHALTHAIAALNTDLIIETALIVAEALRLDFGVAAPRLAVSGLNPHAGEKGVLGGEEAAIIAPAIDRLRARGVNAFGPLPADTMFHEEARAGYDAAICMYHDQALIPAKTLAFHDAVNITLGLPIIRTSPDHGTALDIAGKGVARPDSLIAAINLAAAMAARRGAP